MTWVISTIFECTVCGADFRTPSCKYVYRSGNAEVPVRTGYAWCATCDTVVQCEILESKSRRLHLSNIIAELETKRQAAIQKAKSVWTAISGQKDGWENEVSILELRIKDRTLELEASVARLEMREKRKSGARCLSCHALIAGTALPEFSGGMLKATDSGIRHPRCTGKLNYRTEEVHFKIKGPIAPDVRFALDIEGLPLKMSSNSPPLRPHKKNAEFVNWKQWITRSEPGRRTWELQRALDSKFPLWRELVESDAVENWMTKDAPDQMNSRIKTLQEASESYDSEVIETLLRLAIVGVGFGSMLSDRYEVISSLGRGAFGKVELVLSHELHEFYAMKVLHPELMRNVVSVKRFETEAHILVTMGKHRNVVGVNHVDYVSGRLALLMEYVKPDEKGRTTLRDFLRTSKTDDATAERWAHEIFRGLEHSRLFGVEAHRDVKPENILVSRAVVKVSDFGIASLGDAPQQPSSLRPSGSRLTCDVIGTPLYMAPEQLDPANRNFGKVDAFSVGVLLYETLSGGAWAFGDIDLVLRQSGVNWKAGIRRAILENTPNPINSKMWPFIKACLSPDPANRPETFASPSFQEPAVIETAADRTKWDRRPQALSLARLGHYDEAIEIFDEVIRQFPFDRDARFDRALCFHESGRIDDSVREYEYLCERDHFRALVNLSSVRMEQNRANEALLLAVRASEVEGDDPMGHRSVLYAAIHCQAWTVAFTAGELLMSRNQATTDDYYRFALAALQVQDLRVLRRVVSELERRNYPAERVQELRLAAIKLVQ